MSCVLFISDMEDLDNSSMSLKEKFSQAHAILTSKACKPQVLQDLILWFIKEKDNITRSNNNPNDELELLYQTLSQCLETSQMRQIPIYQMKFNIISYLLQVSLKM